MRPFNVADILGGIVVIFIGVLVRASGYDGYIGVCTFLGMLWGMRTVKP